MKNGREINSTPRVKATEKEGVYTLTISEVLDTDAGDYTCELSNNAGKVSRCIQVFHLFQKKNVILKFIIQKLVQ